MGFARHNPEVLFQRSREVNSYEMKEFQLCGLGPMAGVGSIIFLEVFGSGILPRLVFERGRGSGMGVSSKTPNRRTSSRIRLPRKTRTHNLACQRPVPSPHSTIGGSTQLGRPAPSSGLRRDEPLKGTVLFETKFERSSVLSAIGQSDSFP